MIRWGGLVCYHDWDSDLECLDREFLSYPSLISHQSAPFQYTTAPVSSYNMGTM